MKKKTILIRNESPAIPKTDFWRPVFEQHFNVVQMSPTQNMDDFNPSECVLWGSSPENVLLWVEPWLERGFPVVLDYLWDHFGYSHKSDNLLLLRSNNFILANESLNYGRWGYKSMEFKRESDKFFLCLMNQRREHRDDIFAAIKQYSEESYISYVEMGIQIPGDNMNFRGNGNYSGNPGWQRYVNTEWYNKTNFSLVVETSVNDPRFYSEKILKPFAYKHPSIVWGPPTILDRIKKLGFESFDHIIDESYDMEQDNAIRLQKVLKQVDLLYTEFQKNKNFFNDKLTLEKLEHNYNLFYDQTFINGIIEKEIMGPLLAFAYE